MNIVAFAGAAAVICVLILVLRQQKPELGLTVVICAGIVLTAVVVDSLLPVLKDIVGLVNDTGAGQYLSVVLKGLGICLVTRTASDICRDAGQQSMAGYVETAGRIAMLAAALPLLSAVISVSVEIIKG
ncbi:MAG: hypothetical protein E7554_07760 [Ruminococcaceae bacterium]|nr:hypothetical protein [Oscillospiraceae bacterium]